MNKKVTIDLNQLESLVWKAIAYDYLQMIGVDNWQGYGEVDWDLVDSEHEDIMIGFRTEE